MARWKPRFELQHDAGMGWDVIYADDGMRILYERAEKMVRAGEAEARDLRFMNGYRSISHEDARMRARVEGVALDRIMPTPKTTEITRHAARNGHRDRVKMSKGKRSEAVVSVPAWVVDELARELIRTPPSERSKAVEALIELNMRSSRRG